MIKPLLFVFAASALAGCGTGTVIDFGPEPGTPGDPGYWHYQPELHGPNAPPRDGKAEGASDAPASPAADASGATPATSDSAAQNPAAPSTAGQPAIPAAPPALPTPPPPSATPPAPVSETMFNDAIRRAVATGEIDRALRLLEEAERLGSQSARPAFIDALKGREEN